MEHREDFQVQMQAHRKFSSRGCPGDFRTTGQSASLDCNSHNLFFLEGEYKMNDSKDMSIKRTSARILLRRFFGITAVAFLPVFSACSSAKDSAQADSLPTGSFDSTYSVYAQLLQQFVQGDKVDYAAFSDKKDDLQKVVA